jgi:NAD(P)-dependent dehydrogenase (short-subunit alcohol dehydrogenase family)
MGEGLRFHDRLAIVTGGSRGIGRAYAERFMIEGAAVMIADVDELSAEQTVKDLSTLGQVRFVRCDVSDAASVEACAAATVESFGRIDVLINNAALYGDWNMADQTEEYLKRVFDVNLHGVWLVTRAVAPQMVKQEYGRVINQSLGRPTTTWARWRPPSLPG